MIEFFEQLVNEGKNIKLEISSSPLEYELTIYDAKNLRSELKWLNLVGITKLEKGNFASDQTQYARGHRDDGLLDVWVFPTGKTFNGCEIVEYEEKVLVPATPAAAAIPEHYETVKKKKVVCGGKHSGAAL